MSGGGQGAAAGRIAVVIPCFRVRARIDAVLAGVPARVSRIYCVDDACPEGTGEHLESSCRDPRVEVIRRRRNGGVGAAMVTGYRAALRDGAEVIVKLDGDGQTDPAMLERFVSPILAGQADYTKGNRFFHPEDLAEMPRLRLAGNAVLSFAAKLSTGYWNIFDPTNGYTAIHAAVLRQIPLDKISGGYFFESDMLFRLNTVRAVVLDIPMRARYRDERSNLRVGRELIRFLRGHARNTAKRIFYNYFLRDFHVASLELLLGAAALLFALLFGASRWLQSSASGEPATAGTVMLAGLPVIVGLQLLLSALHFDIQAVPRHPIHPVLPRGEAGAAPGPGTERRGGVSGAG